jgi:hypothetical protein
MKDIEKEDLLRQLKISEKQYNSIDMEAIDFVLLKLNEIKYEVNLRIKEHETKKVEKSVS